MSQDVLESRLWAAANALRGPVDPADFKNYVFPILFFKWISDTWDLEHEEAVADAGHNITPEEEADYHRFIVPAGCHWKDLPQGLHVGMRLREILDRIQQANAVSLAGIFGIVDWADRERIPEANLIRLIDVFDGLLLNRKAVSNDMLGAAYEYLLRQFADESGRKAGEFFTPRSVVHLLVAILSPMDGESIYDPACGSGGMLVETSNQVKQGGGDTRTIRLYGQEVSLTTSAIARMNLFLHDLEDFKVLREDTLREPRFLTSEGALSRFDVVIANPPFSLKGWGQDKWLNDPFERAFCGTPPASSADFAWIQHMISSMKPITGRVGVVMPLGVLFRVGAERSIRQCLIESDLLEAVIGLPGNLFYSTTIPACILIFRSSKSVERTGSVVMVDATNLSEKTRNQNQLSSDDVLAIAAAYRPEQSDLADGVPSRAVPISEIQANDWDLSITRYIGGADREDVDIAVALSEYIESSAAFSTAHDELMRRLKAAGYA